MSLILRFQDDDGDDGGYGDDGGNGHGGDDDGGDLYIIGAVCMYVCMSVCNEKAYFLYSRDLVNSHVYRHIPYSKNLVISPVSGHFTYSKVSRKSKKTKSLAVFKEFGQFSCF